MNTKELNRLRELSGIISENVDVPDVDVNQPSPTPPPMDTDNSGEQILVVKDITDADAETVSIDDLISVVTAEELAGMIKSCGPNCKFTVYSADNRAEAEKDAQQRLDDLGIMKAGEQYNDARMGASEIDNEQMSRDEWVDPVVKIAENAEIEAPADFIPKHIKDQKSCELPEMSKESKSKIKSLLTDLEDCVKAHELHYKHNYNEDNLQDAGHCLKTLEVLDHMKHFLTNGEISQATTYMSSLMSSLQEEIPVSVRKFLHYGGKELDSIANRFKTITVGDKQ